jgi:GNAT superfamily N-acetyltransferase
VAFTRVVDEAGLRRWREVLVATEAHDYVELPADPIDDLRPDLSGPVGDKAVEFWLATDGQIPVAAVQLRMPIKDNLTLANVELHVRPDQRRRGHGRRSLEAIIETARDRGRHRMLIEVPSKTRHHNPSPGTALVQSLGARPLHAETRRLLDITALPTTTVNALDDEAARSSVGYSAISWREHTPAKYVDDMALLTGLMSSDAPQGELDLELEAWDGERYLTREASMIERGRDHLITAVRHDQTGRLVGMTELGVPAGGGRVGYQWDTIVAGEHRGHRLGLRLKVANLRQLTESRPEVRYLNTWNADENTHMVAVNERLGFEPMETWTEFGLDL